MDGNEGTIVGSTMAINSDLSNQTNHLPYIIIGLQMYIIASHEQHDQCHWRFSKCVTFRITLFYFWHFVGVDSVDFRSNVRVAFVLFILNLIQAVTVHPFHDLPLVTFFIGFVQMISTIDTIKY